MMAVFWSRIQVDLLDRRCCFHQTQGDSTATHHRQPAPSANPKTPDATAAKATPTPTQNLAQAIRPTPQALPVLRILRSPRRSHHQPHHAGQRGTRTGARTIELPRRLPQLQRQPRRNRHDDERRPVQERIEARKARAARFYTVQTRGMPHQADKSPAAVAGVSRYTNPPPNGYPRKSRRSSC
jgi:hypothetical protein